MHTEQEAKQLWCPFARSLMDRGAGNRMEYGEPDDDPVNEAACMDQYRAEMATAFPCLASGCAMWRWGEKEVAFELTDERARNEAVRIRVERGRDFVKEPSPSAPGYEFARFPARGYCGLAGKPGE